MNEEDVLLHDAAVLLYRAAVLLYDAAVLLYHAAVLLHSAAVLLHNAAVLLHDLAVLLHDVAVLLHNAAVLLHDAAVLLHDLAVLLHDVAALRHDAAVLHPVERAGLSARLLCDSIHLRTLFMNDSNAPTPAPPPTANAPAQPAAASHVNLPDFFAAPGNPIRWELVRMMAGGRMICARDCAKAQGREFDGVSKHLRRLRGVGVVWSKPAKDRRFELYYIPRDHPPRGRCAGLRVLGDSSFRMTKVVRLFGCSASNWTGLRDARPLHSFHIRRAPSDFPPAACAGCQRGFSK